MAAEAASSGYLMDARTASPWQLVREIGLEYDEHAASRGPVELVCPIAAERTARGRHLIVDDLAADASMHMQCRTLLVSEEGGIVYDSRQQGVDDAYGCAMDEGRFAILRRARWDIVVLSPSGECSVRIDLRRLSILRPRTLAWTRRATFLATFCGGLFELDIVEIDGAGQVLWYLPDSRKTIGLPGSVQSLADGSILVADEFNHVVQVLQRDGGRSIRWGRWHHPSAAEDCLSRPRWARQADDGTLLIADTDNHRVLNIDRSGRVSQIRPGDGSFLAPTCVTEPGNGERLICDGGNRRVLQLTVDGRLPWQYGAARVRNHLFSFPRSVQYLGYDRYLVADTAHNRIVRVGPAGFLERAVNGDTALFWPRAAWRTLVGTVLVADGRNRRVLELSADGRLLRELKQISQGQRDIALNDPHDVKLLANGNLIIVDAARNLVVETDWSGRAAWVVDPESGVQILDPHSAVALSDGRVVIADSSNHRVLIIDPLTRVATEIRELQVGNVTCRLNYPRYVDMADDGVFAIVDSGNNRVLVSDLAGDFLWVLSRIPDSPIPELRLPRWAQLLGRHEIVVTDHSNHRILHLRRRIISRP
jgi:DNA-binding beta-propeller fold protein YncE